MTAWSHLPNAAHIDRVLASVKSHPKAWTAARDAARYAAWDAAWRAARYAARDEAWRAAWLKRDAARDTAWSAVAALIAWDQSAKFLDMTPDELKMWQALSEDPAAILILPAVVAFEKINELELA